MATHTPHVRTKRPLRGRTTSVRRAQARLSRLASRGTAMLRHGEHVVDKRLVRRGPPLGERSAPSDFPFRLAAAGVVLASAVLGIAMGLAQPSWMLAAALVGGGALVAAVVALTNARPSFSPAA